MVSLQAVKPIFGTASIGDHKSFWGQCDDNIRKSFMILRKHGVLNLDSAQAYQGSEAKLGPLKAG
ncbi:Oxidoreductase sirO [Penicillium cf. viridicatum]|uniref:Oxidoreductase sirO n=1 Tax=Penicillium cf. viridicatum TaxID=2972119 RepID=A0A9W9M3K4_9EURO|nr:Oxidoreductase sirO [Penicillium cf. viridicatum]